MNDPEKNPVGDLPGWTFRVDEVSTGVYRVRGTDTAGRSVEATGFDPDALLADAKKTAVRMMEGKPS